MKKWKAIVVFLPQHTWILVTVLFEGTVGIQMWLAAVNLQEDSVSSYSLRDWQTPTIVGSESNIGVTMQGQRPYCANCQGWQNLLL